VTPVTADPDSTYQALAPKTTGRLRVLKVGPLEANLDGKQLRIADTVVPLPLKEFELLAVLMDNAGRVMTRRELLDQVWAPGYPDTNKTLNVHVMRLREHLATADPALRHRLRTVRNLGYIIDL
jgi:two-component system response regulator RegX3